MQNQWLIWDFRYGLLKCWSTKVNLALVLKVLPPTTEALCKHGKMDHLLAAIWRHAHKPDLPEVSVSHQLGWPGWMKKGGPCFFLAHCQLHGIIHAPQEIFRMIECSYSSNQTCQTAQCSCNATQLSCSMFCNYQYYDCSNESTTIASTYHSDNDDWSLMMWLINTN